MNAEPKIALVGAGTMAFNQFQAFRNAGAQVCAFAEPHPERGSAFAAKTGLTRYASTAELYRAIPDLDAVSLITPNFTHAELAKEALQHNLHVFCEKPPARNAGEAEAMREAAVRSGKLLLFDLCSRGRSDARAFKQVSDEKTFGNMRAIQVFHRRRTGIPGFGSWFTCKEQAGGGALIDLVHMFDLALWFMNYPEPAYLAAQTFDDYLWNKEYHSTWGHQQHQNPTADVETANHGFVRFRNGAILSWHISWAEAIKEDLTGIIVQGSEAGGALLTAGEKSRCEIYRHAGGVPSVQTLDIKPETDWGLAATAANFVQAITGQAAPFTNADEAVQMMKLIDAAYRSADTGMPILFTP